MYKYGKNTYCIQRCICDLQEVNYIICIITAFIFRVISRKRCTAYCNVTEDVSCHCQAQSMRSGRSSCSGIHTCHGFLEQPTFCYWNHWDQNDSALLASSSFGFLKNSGISKQISVPRWSSNLPRRMICNPSYRVISGSCKNKFYKIKDSIDPNKNQFVMRVNVVYLNLHWLDQLLTAFCFTCSKLSHQ